MGQISIAKLRCTRTNDVAFHIQKKTAHPSSTREELHKALDNRCSILDVTWNCHTCSRVRMNKAHFIPPFPHSSNKSMCVCVCEKYFSFECTQSSVSLVMNLQWSCALEAYGYYSLPLSSKNAPRADAAMAAQRLERWRTLDTRDLCYVDCCSTSSAAQRETGCQTGCNVSKLCSTYYMTLVKISCALWGGKCNVRFGELCTQENGTIIEPNKRQGGGFKCNNMSKDWKSFAKLKNEISCTYFYHFWIFYA